MGKILRLGSFLLAWSFLIPSVVLAETTDGPEGSEYGKGGYGDNSGNFSLEFNWGAATVEDETLKDGTIIKADGTPLFVGITGAFWMDDWFQLEISGQTLLINGNTNILVGPRFRTAAYPVSFSAGLKAGVILVEDVGARFGISPQLGADIFLADRYLLGLGYATDIPVGTEGEEAHRLFMTLGYRFGS